MKTLQLVTIFIACVQRACSLNVTNALDDLLCDRCQMCCGSGGSSNPIVPKQGPRGPQGARGLRGERGARGPQGRPGRRGPPGGLNEAEVENIVERKLVKGLLSAFATNCNEVNPTMARVQSDTGGVFTIYPPGLGIREVYCDTKTDGGGWTVFQRRMDGSVDFYRNWNEYVNGFGDTKGEFWLGLEAVHLMTKEGRYELRVDMIQINGTHRYAQYRDFSIGPASDHYRLSASGYYGNASNALSTHDGKPFTTKDVDNDLSDTSNCAELYPGAWWFSKCYSTHLNGVYGSDNKDGIEWWWRYTPKEEMRMKFTEMKFRKKY